ncbi:hypothetical protein B0H34DRAFT_522350 [Crassisporium funariophilum]|nr:hypothetical protein B0H34DRAFT_522350 [Crassisporium funariophilum]
MIYSGSDTSPMTQMDGAQPVVGWSRIAHPSDADPRLGLGSTTCLPGEITWQQISSIRSCPFRCPTLRTSPQDKFPSTDRVSVPIPKPMNESPDEFRFIQKTTRISREQRPYGPFGRTRCAPRWFCLVDTYPWLVPCLLH